MKSKKILIISPSFKVGGGAEKVASSIGNGLQKYGYNVTFLSFQDDEKKYRLKGELINLAQPKNIIFKILSIFINPFKIKKIIKEKKIDIIIAHTERANFIAGFIKVLNKQVKVIGVVHNHKYLTNLFNQFFIKVTYKHLDKIITVSKKIESDLKLRFNLNNIETIYNGFDFDITDNLLYQEFENPNDKKYFDGNNFIFVNIGRLVKQKGHKYLIKAFYKLYLYNKNIKLLILGEGPLKKTLMKLVNELGLSNNVFLLGNKNNVFPYLKKSNCFVFSSLWEGFGLVLVEALYSGLPIISTDCDSGPREILAPELEVNKIISYNYENSCGILTKPIKNKNDIGYLYKAMKNMINNKKTINKKEIINNLKHRFDKERILKQWIYILENN